MTDPRPPLPLLRADRMLDRLARWLRLLGADVEPSGTADEEQTLAALRGSGRTLLTRHRRRAARLAALGLPVLAVAAADLGGQLRELAGRYSLPPPEHRFRRCSRCNAPLAPLPAAAAAGWVPPHVARTRDRFSRCPACGRIYWAATHPARFARDLVRLLEPRGAADDLPSGKP